MSVRLLRAARDALLGAAACFLSAAATAAEPLVVIEEAQFVVNDSMTPPPDAAPWQPVRLPDSWHRSRPGFRGVVWYRLKLPVAAPRTVPYAYELPRLSATRILFFAGGHLISGTLGLPDPRARIYQAPIQFAVPPDRIKPADNWLHVRVLGDAAFRDGLTRVTVGEPADVRAIYVRRMRAQSTASGVLGFAAFVLGLAALGVWLRHRSESILFWFALAAVFAGLPATAEALIGAGEPGPGREALLLFYAHAFAPALAIASLRAAKLRWRWFEGGLLALLALGVAAPLVFGVGTYPQLTGPLTLAFFSALTVTLVMLVARAAREDRVPAVTLAASHAVAIALGVYDWAQWQGWLDFDLPTLFQFAPPVLMFGVGTLLASRYFRTVDALDALNRDLERRIAERGTEIERAYQHVGALEHAQAVAQERQRIMADIHDGLGASLVNLLSVVQGGRVGPRGIEERVHDALQELRLAVDSLDTPEGDLATALGMVRHRLRDALEAAGVELGWRIGELPLLEDMTPSRVLQVQRIVLEALSNALRHAGAKRIELSAEHDAAAREARVVVADDGKGFAASELPSGGRGLASMRRRASVLGARLEIDSRTGAGTRVALALPVK